MKLDLSSPVATKRGGHKESDKTEQLNWTELILIFSYTVLKVGEIAC